MKNRSWQTIICVVAIITLVFASYNWVAKAEKAQLNIIYIPKIVDETNEFWTSLIAGARMSANEHDVNLQIVAPTMEDDYEEQNELILWAIEQKPDVIMVSPCDYTENTEMVKKIAENGIKLVLIDSEVSAPVGDCIVATDNFIAGKRIGQLAKEYIDEETSIAIVSHVKNSSTAIERIEGFEYEIGEATSQIVDVVYCDSQYEKAYELTCALMLEHPEINLIIGTNEYSAVGAAQAIKDLGLQNQVRMIGFDNSIEEVQLLEEQVFEGIVIQKSFNMGYLGVEQAIKVARGEEVQKKLDSGSVVITNKNMYEQENQKLLFPFIGKQFREAVTNEAQE